MKLPDKIIEHLCRRALDHLKDRQLIRLKGQESQVLARMIRAMKEDLGKESALDAEIRQMLEKFRDKINRGEIDEQKMYQMIKKQLIKERNLVF